MDVAGEDEVGAGLDEPREDAVPLRDGLLARAPRRPEQVVVQGDDPVGARGNLPEDLRGLPHLLVAHTPRLVPPRSNRVEPGDDERFRAVHRLGRLPLPLELRPGPGEPPRERVRDVVVAGDRQQRQLETAEEGRRPLVLAAQAPVGQIAARDHEVRARFLDQPAQRLDRFRPVVSAEMQVGKVENTCRHSRLRLYSPEHGGPEPESPEIFDDLYLGLRAGGALRKQRRGEPLTTEEQEALGRWQRLSIGRKALAVGAFSLGTFGLGFTLGGLIFGRWRKA